MIAATQWSRGFAKQASADLATFHKLHGEGGLPKSQALHFLQMACEKICKAYLCRNGADPLSLQASHAYIAKTISQIVRSRSQTVSGHKLSNPDRLLQQVRLLAREIELLQPAVDAGGSRPDNCEYPWEQPVGRLNVPADHAFPSLDLLKQPAGFHLLKMLDRLAAELST